MGEGPPYAWEIYNVSARVWSVNQTEKVEKTDTNSILHLSLFTGEGTGVESYVRRKTVETTLKQWRNKLSVHQESSARVQGVAEETHWRASVRRRIRDEV